jgi:hypothetical protein
MIRLPTACLLLLLCLLTRPASSQAIAPLAPTVVRLEIGDVAQRPLIGLDTATYRSTRQYVASAGQLLLVRADRIAQLERNGRLADSLQVAYAYELRRCQAGRAASDADYERMRAATRVALASPPRPPWLLDSHTYKGVGAGVVLAALLKAFVFN